MAVCPYDRQITKIGDLVKGMIEHKKLQVFTDTMNDKIVVMRLDMEDRRLYCSNVSCKYGGFKCKHPEVEEILKE